MITIARKSLEKERNKSGKKWSGHGRPASDGQNTQPAVLTISGDSAVLGLMHPCPLADHMWAGITH